MWVLFLCNLCNKQSHAGELYLQYKIRNMKQTIFTNWNFMRFLRLGLGFAVLVQAAMAKDVTFVILGLLFTSMPVFNIGCCGANGCYVPQTKKEENTKDISYEEVV